MRYKKGDKVRVRKDLEVGKYYGWFIYNDEKTKYAGKDLTISNVNSKYYYMREDNCEGCWTDEMLELVPEMLSVKELTYWFKRFCDSHLSCSLCPLGDIEGRNCANSCLVNRDKVIQIVMDYKVECEKKEKAEESKTETVEKVLISVRQKKGHFQYGKTVYEKVLEANLNDNLKRKAIEEALQLGSTKTEYPVFAKVTTIWE